MAGYLVFSGGRPGIGKWYERFFRWVLKGLTKSKWSHVALMQKTSSNITECLILEATYPKVQEGKITDLIPIDRNYLRVVKINGWDESDYNRIFEMLCRQEIGKNYALVQVIIAAIAFIFRLPNLISYGRSCSELVKQAFDLSGQYHNLFDRFKDSTISPQDIENTIRAWFYDGNAQIELEIN